MAAFESARDSEAVKNGAILPRPRRVLLFSGKRKSGKDYITDILQKRLESSECVTLRISGPIKSHFAESLNLDLKKLLGDGAYKEKYRVDMIAWGEEMRSKDHGYFCRAAVDMFAAKDKPVWIVSDVRRKTDVEWFVENFGDACRSIRIIADDRVRSERGWIFTPGIDDAESECDLDDFDKWDLEVANNEEDVDDILLRIIRLVE